MFLSNKYTKWYNQIVARALKRGLTKKSDTYIEMHHIVPRSMGGGNKKENLVSLTAREHFICHWLLVKMTTGKGKASMVYALNFMHTGRGDHMPRYITKISSKVYAVYRAEFIKIHIASRTGKKQSAETIAKRVASFKEAFKTMDPAVKKKISDAVSESNKNRVYTDEMRAARSRAFKGVKKSDQAKKNMSAAQTGLKRKPLSEEHKNAISTRMKGEGNPNFGKKYSLEELKLRGERIKEATRLRPRTEEYRKKMSKAITGKIRGAPTQETRIKIAEGIRNAIKGRSIEDTEAISKIRRDAALSSRVECEHCKKVIPKAVYVRCHGIKCKQIPA